MGAQVIQAITSGLGLISDLAKEFLDGFTALFWDATANNGSGALTTFGLYACIFLGISVSFAIIKLCLNLVRGNTGA